MADPDHGFARVELPGTLKFRDAGLRVLAQACELVTEGDATFREAVISAFSEAFNNIVLHAYRDDPNGRIVVEIEITPRSISIRLTDNGASFDPAAISAPDLQSLPESGLGLFIIKSFMDTVEYEPGHPNVLTMTKRAG